MRRPEKNGNGDDSALVALRALAWVLSDDMRADRLLALTGLTPDQLRVQADQPAMLAATVDFLRGHEPDLLACAQAIGVTPEELAAAGRSLAA